MNISSLSSTQNNSIMSVTAERDACIVEMLDEVRGMVFNLCRNYELCFEDAMQEAACEMLEVWSKIPAKCARPKAYLHRCVRNRIFKMRFHPQDELSLDVPIATNGKVITYADMLEAPVHTQDTTRVDAIAETIHCALHECMIEEQEYAVKSFEMYAFTPVAPATRRKGRLKAVRPINWNQVGNIRASMLLALRKHPQVLSLIQRETCVL